MQEWVGQCVSRLQSGYFSSRYLATETAGEAEKETKKTAEKPIEADQKEFADQLETELPDAEDLPQEALDQLSEEYKSILDEKDEALKQLSGQVSQCHYFRFSFCLCRA